MLREKRGKTLISAKNKLANEAECLSFCTLSEASVAQLVEHHLAKVDVEGSNPFARSNFFLKIRVVSSLAMDGTNAYFHFMILRCAFFPFSVRFRSFR